jgi:hypothetical protein
MAKLKGSQADIPNGAHPGGIPGAHGDTVNATEKETRTELLFSLCKYSCLLILFLVLYRSISFCVQATNGSESCFSPAFALTTMTVGSSES